ncbi:MAG: hypothetical protein R3B13_34185 [Polyangiaceae bacterium]
MELPTPPEAKDDDSDDVRWALETANAIWARGEIREALQWIRRAAEAAAEAGADMRAVQLAKSAAELRGLADVPRTVPPPADSPAAPPPAPAKAKERVRHHAVRVAVSLSMEEMGALVARPLKSGEAPPAGAHEAVLVALDPEADLFVFKG